MKRMYVNFMRTFAFTAQDRNGLIVLIGLIFITLIFKVYYPFWLIDHTPLPKEVVFTNSKSDTYTKPSFETSIYADSSTKFQTNKKYAPKIEKKIFTLHLNTADTLDFQELRGIGSGYAKRIFNYRQKLGGFVRKEQLLEVWGIDSALYQSILPFIILDIDQIEKININTIDLQSLKKHPYLDYYQAKEIIKYREKKGGFQSVNELKKVNLMDGNTFEKLHLYLSIK
ncbi:MAG: helix-hairpin-helix domain-containing protein [Bacteroidales bacterium]